MSFDVLNDPAQAESIAVQTPGAADILDFLGIDMEPEERTHIPPAEQRLLLDEAQSGSTEAMRVLITQRLDWLSKRCMKDPGLREWAEREPEDFMQQVALSVIDAASDTPLDSEQFGSRFALKTARSLRTGLQDSRPIAGARQGESTSGEAEWLEYSEALQLRLQADPLKPDTSPERAAYTESSRAEAGNVLRGLYSRDRKIVANAFGLGQAGAKPLKREQIAAEFKVTPQAVSWITATSLTKLRKRPGNLKALVDLVEPADQTNYGLTNPAAAAELLEYTPEELAKQAAWLQAREAKREAGAEEAANEAARQQAKREIWLQELRDRQAAGEIVFVKEPLLLAPLPPEIQDYLDMRPDDLLGNPAHMLLRRVLDRHRQRTDSAYRVQQAEAAVATVQRTIARWQQKLSDAEAELARRQEDARTTTPG